MALTGQYALITGSSRGIGRGIALKLAQHGVKVAIHYYEKETTAKVAPHLTVVRFACNENGGPAILLLARFHAKPGGQAWTPQPYSARIWPALRGAE